MWLWVSGRAISEMGPAAASSSLLLTNSGTITKRNRFQRDHFARSSRKRAYISTSAGGRCDKLNVDPIYPFELQTDCRVYERFFQNLPRLFDGLHENSVLDERQSLEFFSSCTKRPSSPLVQQVLAISPNWPRGLWCRWRGERGSCVGRAGWTWMPLFRFSKDLAKMISVPQFLRRGVSEWESGDVDVGKRSGCQ